MIYEFHRQHRGNAGDFYCNPSRYFNDFVAKTRPIHLQDNPRYQVTDAEGKIVVIGGGGLIHPTFTENIEFIVKQQPAKLVVWGIGTNYDVNKDRGYPKWLGDADMIGLRDANNIGIGEYVPCVTCMHPAFDSPYEIKHDKVYYLHARKEKPDVDAPVLTNKAKDIYNIIRFLASGETVVTTSYHGAYWAMLLGRNVQVVPWSTKFKTFKYTPVMLESINDVSNDTMYIHPTYLEECRDLNKRFYERFKNLCGL